MGTAMAGLRWSNRRPDPAGEASAAAGSTDGTDGTDGTDATDVAEARAAVEVLFRSRRLYLVRLARLLVDDRETAEDVVQDAFAGLHRRWRSLRSPDAAEAYLRTAVVNGSRSALRRRRTARSQRWPDQDVLVEDAADRPALLAAEHRAVLDAMRRLPGRQREVLVLRYWAELGEAEIARMLGISVGAVKSSASRGRDAVAAMLRDAERGV
jgi:RNA polymerase sigma-70 factor (sigma-E family)